MNTFIAGQLLSYKIEMCWPFSGIKYAVGEIELLEFMEVESK